VQVNLIVVVIVVAVDVVGHGGDGVEYSKGHCSKEHGNLRKIYMY
jgi:hypothetical protein